MAIRHSDGCGPDTGAAPPPAFPHRSDYRPTSTTFPTVSPFPSSSWARAACSSGSLRSMTGLRSPRARRPNSVNQDTYAADVRAIPQSGGPTVSERPEHVLRGGCFHNWAVHCTVSKRYQMERQYLDGCIGFRVVLAEP